MMNEPGGRSPANSANSMLTVDIEKLLKRQADSWRLGSRETVETLLEANAVDSTRCNADTLLSLICHEVSLRKSSNEPFSLEEYGARFPHLVEELKIQWEIDELLQLDSDVAPDVTLRAMDLSHGTAITHESRQGSILPLKINRYEIVGEIGRGGIGVVYEAWDPKLKRRVAIKRLKAGVDASTDELIRIRAEAEAIAKLHHPNIVQVYDVGEDGWPYFAMEFCHGRSLDARLAGQPLSPRVAAELVRKISLGISAAHDNRIIHRDLKPANVLLEREHDWSPKVVDFGLAKFLDGDSSATASGSILGTAAYMSPEQAFGDAKRVGESTDIYSLGAILYECLTGRPPFRGDTFGETLDQVRNQEPIRVRQLEPKVPLDLETITHTCLRKDPKQRYARVGDLINDLANHLDRIPITARRERWYELTWRLARRNPMAASLCVATASLLLALTTGSLLFANYMYATREIIQREKALAQIGHAEAMIGRAHGVRLSGKPGQRFDALESLRQAAAIGRELNQPPEWFEPLRDEAIAALQLPDIYTQNYREEGRILVSADFSDDHSLCALSFEGEYTSLRRLSDQYELAKIPNAGQQVRIAFIGNNQLLQFEFASGSFELWKVDLPTPQRIWRRETDCNNFFLSENQRYLAVVNASTLQWINLEDGSTRNKNALTPFFREPAIAIHPTLPIYVVFGYYNSRAELREIATGKAIWEFECDVTGDERFSGGAWSPDGTRLALLHGHSKKSYWFRFEATTQKLTSESVQILTPDDLIWGSLIQFDHTGGYIVGYGWGEGVMLVDSFRKRRIALGRGLTHFERFAPKTDPRGQLLGFAASLDRPTNVGTMQIATAEEFPCLFWNDQGKYAIHSARLDPTGSFVIIPGPSGFAIIDIHSRQEIYRTEIEGLGSVKICFDRNGHFLLSTAYGVLKWPYAITESPHRKITLGFPHRIPLPALVTSITSSNQGNLIASTYWNGLGSAAYAGCWVLASDEVAGRKIIGGSSGTTSAVSQNGLACILSLEDRSMLLQRTKHGWDQKPITNDGTCHIVCNDQIALAGDAVWSLPEWTQLNKTPSLTVCISDDAKQIAIASQSGNVSLAHTESGKTFAKFPGSPVEFSRDAESFLFVIDKDLKIARLPLIRQRLLELGISWEGPEYSSSAEKSPLQRIETPTWLADISSAQQLMLLIDEKALESASQHPGSPHDLFASGMVLLNRHQLQPALMQLEQVCRLMPDSVTAHQWRTYALAALGRFDEAIQVADGVLSRTEDFDFRLMRAEWLYQTGQYERARNECTNLMNGEKRVARNSLALRSLCSERLGQVAEAQEDMEQFRKLAPEDTATLNLNARIWTDTDLSLRHPILAQIYLDKLLQQRERLLPEVKETIAITFIRNGRYEEALTYCKELLADPNVFSYRFGLACQSLCQANMGQLESAQVSLNMLSRSELPEADDAKLDLQLQSIILEARSILFGKLVLQDR